MYSFAAKKCIFRDQLKSIPMPDEVISYLNSQAENDGYSTSDMPLATMTASSATRRRRRPREPTCTLYQNGWTYLHTCPTT
jgi:hypothetical protein